MQSPFRRELPYPRDNAKYRQILFIECFSSSASYVPRCVLSIFGQVVFLLLKLSLCSFEFIAY